MSHMVIYRSADGKPNYEQVEQLDEAIRLVERLRNEQGVTDAKLFDLVEVPISFKAYYQVEVGNRPAPAETAPAPAAQPQQAQAPASAPEPAAPVAAPAATPAATPAVKPGAPVAATASAQPDDKVDASSNGGRFGLFGKS